MIVLAGFGLVVLLALAIAATWMAVVGLMGITGMIRLRRCRGCGHMLPSTRGSTVDCPYCRHPRLLHGFSHARLKHLLPAEWS
jgi:DNA-directed RNA polymerase subunit RPC12/RpoP